jgi:phytoene dehydrogenase-like protein
MDSPVSTNPRSASTPDVVIVGSGPNGLTAGILLARAGLGVEILEANDQPGGGCRSAELTLPGFVHDVCSAIHPMGVLSPVFNDIGLVKHGLAWSSSRIPLAHPLPNGSAAILEHSMESTAQRLGPDGRKWRQLLSPFTDVDFIRSLLGPVWHPGSGALLTKARFGLVALRSCEQVARSRFDHDAARALFAGCAAHSTMSLDRAGTASFGLVLTSVGHAVDWPCARGGSQSITSALVRAFESHGGVLRLGHRITTLNQLPHARAIVFDLSPRQVAQLAGHELPPSYRSRLARFRHGAGVFKIDWALSRPIPWRNEECRTAATVHVCGSFEEILQSEREVSDGRTPERPFVLVAQQSLIDRSRAPAGQHTGWAYCHVPNGCTVDMTERIERQIERFAPGFRDCVLAKHTTNPAQLEAYNAAMIGGDMAGGENSLSQFLFRPFPRFNPYTTPNPRLFLCSSSTPPGGGVHGMCGYPAARAVMKRLGVSFTKETTGDGNHRRSNS